MQLHSFALFFIAICLYALPQKSKNFVAGKVDELSCRLLLILLGTMNIFTMLVSALPGSQVKGTFVLEKQKSHRHNNDR